MIFFVNLQVSDPYRRADFTLELEILIFVHSEMNFDLHMGLKMEMGEGGAKQKPSVEGVWIFSGTVQ